MHTQMHFLMPFVVVAVLVVIVVSTIYGLIQARKRLEGLNELALRLGLNFSAAEDRELAERYGFLKQLAQGENRYAQNVLSGTFQQNQVLAFDFHYETYHRMQRRTPDAPSLVFLFHFDIAGGFSRPDHPARKFIHEGCRGVRLPGHQVRVGRIFQDLFACGRRTKNSPTTSAMRK